MTIPLHTTTIRVERPVGDENLDPYDAGAALPLVIVASGVRAHLSSPGGSGTDIGGFRETTTWRLLSDPVDLTHLDAVIDETTGERYKVDWAQARYDEGVLDHTVANVKRVLGAA